MATISKSKAWKPQLLCNEESGVVADWEARIKTPSEWVYSVKKDGIRVELFADGGAKGRSLKPIPSVHINIMAEDIALALSLEDDIVIESEFYAHSFTFPELVHFYKTEDVTSIKTRKKYEALWRKTGGDIDKGWKFPGRDVDFLCQWHDELKLHAFGLAATKDYDIEFEARYDVLESLVIDYTDMVGEDLSPDIVLVQQQEFSSVDELYQAHDQAVLDDYEGLVVMKKKAQYKPGRFTINEAQGYKIVDSLKVYDGVILAVTESTVVKEGTTKKVNELGRSKTSQLQEDRLPSGMAAGFRVRMDDGKELKVSLKKYNHEKRKLLWEERTDYLGMSIRFTAKLPVAIHGVPRQAFFMEFFEERDDK